MILTLYLVFNGVMVETVSSPALMTIFLEYGACKANSRVFLDLKTLLFILVGTKMIPLQPLVEMRQEFLSGIQAVYKKKLYISYNSLDALWIQLGKMRDSLHLRVAQRYIFGQLICLNFQNRYGRVIKVALIVSNGIKKDTYLLHQHLKTSRFSYGHQSQEHIF